MARILFVHNNFPGRFEFLLPALRAAGHQMVAIAQGGRQVDGVPLLIWKNERPNTPGILDLALRAETDFLRGRAAADCAIELKRSGFEPDLIIGHPAWGETIFMKEIFPDARQILVGEFYYRSRGGDVGFDPEFERPTLEDNVKVHAKNAAMAMAYADDNGVGRRAYLSRQGADHTRPRRFNRSSKDRSRMVTDESNCALMTWCNDGDGKWRLLGTFGRDFL